jgi:hypothetical protein
LPVSIWTSLPSGIEICFVMMLNDIRFGINFHATLRE